MARVEVYHEPSKASTNPIRSEPQNFHEALQVAIHMYLLHTPIVLPWVLPFWFSSYLSCFCTIKILIYIPSKSKDDSFNSRSAKNYSLFGFSLTTHGSRWPRSFFSSTLKCKASWSLLKRDNQPLTQHHDLFFEEITNLGSKISQ